MTVSPGISNREALQRLDDTGAGCLFVENETGNFVGIITDTDIRRGILAGADLYEPAIVNKNPVVLHSTAPEMMDWARRWLQEGSHDLIPLVQDGKIETFFTRDNFTIPCPVVIMAGGSGRRLAPESDIVPKPLMPVHGKAIIEHIIEQFRTAGADDIRIVVNYKAQLIKAYLANEHFITEGSPRGTAGILADLEIRKDYFLTNCDIMVRTDLPRILRHHQEGGYILTLVGAIMKNVIAYGSCHLEEGRLQRIEEKPVQDYIANTGLYVINPKLHTYVCTYKMDMTDLIAAALAAGEKVGVYPVSGESWIDIGQWEEYKKVLVEWKKKE